MKCDVGRGFVRWMDRNSFRVMIIFLNSLKMGIGGCLVVLASFIYIQIH